MTPNLYDNIQILSKLIGIYTHPLFKTQPKYSILEETQPLITSEQHNAVNSITGLPQTNLAPGLKENILTVSSNALNQLSSMTNLPSDKIEPNFIIINNTKVDYATAKILNYVWSFSKFVVLKYDFFNLKVKNIFPFRLNRNYLDEITFLQFQELVMNTNNKISKFFFEWNILQSEIALPFYNQLALSPSIEFLILRSNALTDEIFVPFCDKLLETNNQILRLLDVYDNNLTKKCRIFFKF